MYTLLVNDDNTIVTTKKERIVQRSKLCDNIHILVPQKYKDMDMQKFEVMMFYQLPISGEKYSIPLQPEPELYKVDYLEYKIPADTWITKEAGVIQIILSFTFVDMTDESEVVQYVRKATGGTIEIASCEDWGSALADNLLQVVDQRIIQMQIVAKQLDETAQNLYGLYDNKADDLSYEDGKLQLQGGGKPIGHEVEIKPNCECEDHDSIKVIEF